MATIGQTIREARELRGWSQQELADRAGVTKSWVQQLETDIIEDPGLKRSSAVCAALGMDISKLSTPDELRAMQTAQFVGAQVMEAMGKLSIPVQMRPTSNCDAVITQMFIPITEGTQMLKGHKLGFFIVNGDDCKPFALNGEVLLTAEDVIPSDGETVVFKGEDNHCHAGTYHRHEGEDVVLVPDKEPLFIAPEALRGPVVWKVQVLKAIEPAPPNE